LTSVTEAKKEAGFFFGGEKEILALAIISTSERENL